jgi:predicted esterase
MLKVKMLFFKKSLLLFISIISAMVTSAQQTAEKSIIETKYLLYLPDGYAADTAKKWPLMIFLHGSGESGSDLAKVKANGPPKLAEAGKKFPFIIVSPQAPPNTGWQDQVMKALLDSLKNKYRVDKERIYLTGLSMGGFGTWNIAEKFPEEFAAIAPICGGGDEQKVWELRHMPVWCFHGAKDDVVPLAASQRMVDALKKYNGDVKFTVYPDANHNSWEVTYNNDSLYTWLLAQKKFRYIPVAVPQNILKDYTGTYVNEKRDTINFELKSDTLLAKPPGGVFPLKASSNTNFYWDDNSLGELHFTRSKNEKVSGFILYTGGMEEFKKVTDLKK